MRLVAALLVDLRIEPGVLVGVGDVDDLAGLCHIAREPLPDREADFDDVVPRATFDQSSPVSAIQEIQRPPVGVDAPRGGFEDEPEKLVDFDRGIHDLARLDEHVEAVHLFL